MENYLINEKTLAIISNDLITKVIEEKAILTINKSSLSIIDESCKYYFSSFHGRCESTKYLLNINCKVPIIISESKQIIFFPTNSPYDKKCIWLNYDYVNKFYEEEKYINVILKNDYLIKTNITARVLNNQILKTSRLISILKSNRE